MICRSRSAEPSRWVRTLTSAKLVACLGIGAAVLTSPVGSQPDAKELRYATTQKERAKYTVETRETFKRVTKLTKGELTFRIYANGVLYNTRGAVKALSGGVADFSQVIWVLHPSEFPHATLPAQFATINEHMLQAAGALSEFHLVTCKECIKEYKKINVMPLGTDAASRYSLMCNRKISNIKALKGLRVRAVGAMSHFAVELGMVPTRVAGPEIVGSMQRGVLDCAYAVLPWLYNYGLADVSKHVIDRGQGAALGGGMLWMRYATWKSLTKSQRRAFRAALPDHAYRMVMNAADAEARQMLARAKSSGIVVTDGGAAMAAAWKRFRAKERNRVIKIATKRGIKNPAKFVDSLIKVFSIWSKEMKGQETSREKFVELMRTRVMAKSPILNNFE